jgi:hypothetical protein
MLRNLIQVPEDIVERVPDPLKEQVGQIADQVEANPALLGILAAIGVITALLFVWGIFKQAFKAVLFGGLLSAGAWYWFFNIR